MKLDEKYLCRHSGLKVKVAQSVTTTFDAIGNNDCIVALKQTRGIGRGDHTFHSPHGGVYLGMRLRGLSINAHTLTPAIGLAVHEVILRMFNIETSLKWINDVYLGDKKICGILVKSPIKAEYIVGIGINYATPQSEFIRVGLQNTAGSLNAPQELATQFVAELIAAIRRAALSVFDCAAYSAHCSTIGKNIRFIRDGVTVEGYAERVEQDGTLIVRIGSATVAVDSGEISHLDQHEK